MRATLMWTGITLVLLKLLACLGGCASASSAQREIARAAVLTTSEAVHASDLECARVVKATGDRELGEACDATYVKARAALVGVASAVDVWDATADRKGVTCAVVNASRDLAILARVIVSKGGRPLPVVSDAVALVSRLGDCTEGGP